MISNYFFWVGLVLAPIILWLEWKVFQSFFSRKLTAREKISGMGLIVFMTILVLLTVVGVIE